MMIRAFRHGRLVTREQAVNMSRYWVGEMDRFERTRTEEQRSRVNAYVHQLLSRISRRAKA